MRYASLIMGPAGSDKSTFCRTVLSHLEAQRRAAHVINLDPGGSPGWCFLPPAMTL